MRILAIDYGLKRIGLAVSSTVASMALPLETIEHWGCPEKAALLIFKKVESLADISEIVIGWPLHLNGKISPLCQQIEKLQAALSSLMATPIVLVDERLTTKILIDSFKSHGFSRKSTKNHIDQASAVMILNSHLEKKRLSKI
jgi:putative Holliday junction resolvase